jgi:uncharacterized protein
VQFISTVPVLDDHVAIGRPHNVRAANAGSDDLVASLDRCGITAATVYHPHAVHFDTRDGNAMLMDAIGRHHNRLWPRFVVNFAAEPTPEAFACTVADAGVRSVLACPKTHLYPLAGWIVDPWLEWLAAEGLGLWLPMDEVDVSELHTVLSRHPRVPVVLTGVHYSHHTLLGPLGRALPNLHLNLARYDVAGGVRRLLDVYGEHRLLFGSNWPTFDAGPYLYYLHQAGLGESALRAITHDNLARLLGLPGGEG